MKCNGVVTFTSQNDVNLCHHNLHGGEYAVFCYSSAICKELYSGDKKGIVEKHCGERFVKYQSIQYKDFFHPHKLLIMSNNLPSNS